MFLYSLNFFESNLGQIIKVRIFWTRLVRRKHKILDFLDKNFWSPDFEQTAVSEIFLKIPKDHAVTRKNFIEIFSGQLTGNFVAIFSVYTQKFYASK